ncbi:3'(2'),5'-bisphosphate nucleotidase CysQ [Persicimonas caeni]|uniref:3'(2'),5'-bisphosphate nucleotidase CysQ n=1 Tax=Persicimonas caeni TaxID=2292766 RepID=A0A4Y6Q0S1_PERCE|nr:3'(2'),5'-bisphosphate nucleotidase CysQ [Persicimonas caeni]QDG53595.1 3'(2'),5'-bisphosphate nucleotidase CysQ [Persicimonas caeni]QED34816.1 3'(2'),5'-bisphosphate nucleotidase CysQ [Persicimonas caeni]
MPQKLELLSRDVARQVVELAERAGEAIMEIYETADFETQYKEDESPLTAADLAAHRVLVEGLQKLTPDVPVLSEESKGISYEERRDWGDFWLVDPLDGTKEFIKRNGEFTVNVALIRRDEPVMGVVHAPALETSYYAVKELGAFKRTADGEESIETSREVQPPLTVVVSRSHLRERDEQFIEQLRARYDEVELSPTGSALKLCLVAEGTADVYPRFGPTMEWDIGAAQCVVEQAGGVVLTEEGEPLRYNKKQLVNPFFIARTPAVELP